MRQRIKILLSIGLLFCLAMPVQAQKSIGLLGGYNLTNMLRSPARVATSHEQKLRFAGGFMAEFGLLQKLSLQVEPMYVQKGANFDFIDEETFNAQRDEVDLGYVELPVLLKLRLQNRLTAPYLVAGPSFSLLLSAKQGDRRGKQDIKDSRETFDMGIGGGAGVFLASERIKLFVELRYNYGLTNIDKTATDGSRLRNNGLRILLGVLM